MRLGRSAVLIVAAGISAPGCGGPDTEPSAAADDTGSVCPADDPDCDRLDEPDVMDEGEAPSAR
jgi:hypothetical protein